MANPNFDNIVATTLKAYFGSGKATDNIFKRTAFLDWILKNRLATQGGSSAVMPIENVINSTFQTYSGYDALTPAHGQEIITAAEYVWKQAAIYIPMSGIEEAKNGGKQQIINLLKAKTENAERTAAEQFETMALTYYGTENSSKGWGGLPLLVGNETSTVTTVGGIDCTADTYWRASRNVVAAALTLPLLSNAYNTVSFGADACDFEITTQALWEKYEGLLQPSQRFMDAKTAEAGFSNLMHRGSKVVWSDLMPSGLWYFLNSRHIKLAVLDGKWMDFKGFVQPYDRDAKYGLITNYGTWVTDERRKLGVRAYT